MGSVRLWKDVLHPGRQRDKHGNWFTITPADTRTAAANVRRMVARGLRIPAVWEHQPGAEPVEMSRGDRLANYVKHAFGEVRRAKVDDRGVLWLEHEVYDPKDAAALRRKRLQVSPKLYPSYSDSRGGEYPGATIGHVAATPTPIQFWQGRDWPKELSRDQALFLSYTPENAVADDDDDKGGEGEGGDLHALIEALREAGLNIPDECEDLKHLVIAVKAAAGKKAGGDEDDLELPPEEEGAGETGTAGSPTEPPSSGATTGTAGPPVLMSDDRAEPLRKVHRPGLKQRLKRLFETGREVRQVIQQRMRQVDGFGAREMSYTRDGDLSATCEAAKLEAWIEARESLKPWTAWRPKGNRPVVELSATDPTDLVPHPDRLTGDGTGGPAEDVIKKQEELARRLSATTK